MSSDSNHDFSVPSFESKLPAELLTGKSEDEKYMYRTLDSIHQSQKWLTGQVVKNSDVLLDLKNEIAEVKAQTIKTNGRTTANEGAIVGMQPEIETVKLVKKVVSSRYFWIGAGALVVFGVPWLAVHAPGAASFFHLLFGA